MGRIFNVLVPVIVLSAYFQGGFGFCSSGNSFGTLTGTGGFSGGAAGGGAFVGQAVNGGATWGSGTAANSGTGNGNGFINTGNSVANDDSVYSSGYNRGTGNSASSWSIGYQNSAAYGSGSATSNGNFGNGGGNLGYSQGGGAYNGGGNLGYSQGGGAYIGGGNLGYSQGGGAYNGDFNGQYGSNSASGGSGGAIRYNSHPGLSFMREVASDIADTVVDAIEVGHSLMHRPHQQQSYVTYSRPAYVRQVVRVPARAVSVHRGHIYGGCRH